MATIDRSEPAMPTSVSNRIALRDSRLDLAHAPAFAFAFAFAFGRIDAQPGRMSANAFVA